MSDVKYIITADAKGAVKEIKKVDGAIDGMKTQAKKAKSPLKGMFKQIAVGVGSIAGAAVAIRGLAGFMGDCISQAIEQERVTAQLESVLRSTGGAAGLTKEELIKLADKMQDLTTYSNEEVQSAENLLLTFTKIGKDVFPATLTTVLDMSTALGQDLKSSAIQVGKALQDPILGVTALRRVGVDFNDQQKEEIRLLVESGRQLDAQKLILQELQVEFGGAAKAAADTFGGSLKQLGNTFDDLKKQLGEAIIENLNLQEAVSDLNLIIGEMNKTKDKDRPWYMDPLKLHPLPILYETLRGEMHKAAENIRDDNAYYEGMNFLLGKMDEGLELLGIDLNEIIPLLGLFTGGNKDLKPAIDDVKTSTELLTTAIKAQNRELELVFETIDQTLLPAYREWPGLVYNTQEELKTHVFNANDEIVTDVETTIKNEISPLWDNLSTDLSRSFGDAFEDILTEGSDFSDAMVLLIGGLKDSIIGFFGDMVTGFFKNNVFAAMSKEATKAASGVKDTLSGLATGGGAGGTGGAGGLLGAGGGAATGLWTGLGAAAGTLLAGLITGGGVSKRTGQDQLHEARLTNILLYQTQQHELHWINDNLNLMYTQFTELLLKSDAMIRIQRDIRKNLGGIPKGQHGLDFYSGSRGGYVQYDPYEHIMIQPKTDVNITPSATQINVYLDGKKIKEQLTWDSKWRGWKLHPRVTNKRF